MQSSCTLHLGLNAKTAADPAIPASRRSALGRTSGNAYAQFWHVHLRCGERMRNSGFTLLEVIITVAIVAILAAIAFPSYTEYVRRGQLPESFTNLSNAAVRMEQFFQDNRTYPTGGCVIAPTVAAASQLQLPAANRFAYACGTPTATAFTISATGITGSLTGGFTYSINQANARLSTVSGVAGWTGNGACWVTRRGGQC